MNKILLLIIVFLIAGIGLYKASASVFGKDIKMSDKKVLIAYYSHSGNTKAVAEKIKTITNGHLFEIRPVKAYPNDYNTLVNLAKNEKQNDIKPEIVDNVDVENYDIIFVGTPVWWYTMAPPVKTFLTQNDFKGKIIVPFCTHGGGGESSTYSDIKKLAFQAKVMEGFTTYENSAKITDIEKWINGLNL